MRKIWMTFYCFSEPYVISCEEKAVIDKKRKLRDVWPQTQSSNIGQSVISRKYI